MNSLSLSASKGVSSVKGSGPDDRERYRLRPTRRRCQTKPFSRFGDQSARMPTKVRARETPGSDVYNLHSKAINKCLFVFGDCRVARTRSACSAVQTETSS